MFFLLLFKVFLRLRVKQLQNIEIKQRPIYNLQALPQETSKSLSYSCRPFSQRASCSGRVPRSVSE